jgi:UPF0271 protein
MTLNCDLGEGEPTERTESLMRVINLANIACGGHAGDRQSMEQAIGLAKRFGVLAGAHPGLPDRGNFGRTKAPIGGCELEALLIAQMGALQLLAEREAVQIHHVKLHGALYHQVDQSPELAEVYLRTVAQQFSGVVVVAFAGGLVADRAVQLGRPVLREAFAERGYLSDGKLIPRGQAGDVLTSLPEIAQQVERIRSAGSADTICVHSDHPDAVTIATRVAECLR